MSLALLATRDSLAMILLAAGSAKLSDLEAFAATLSGLGIRGTNRPRRLGASVATVEVGLGLLTVAGWWPAGVDLSNVLLLAVFSAVTGLAVRRKLAVKCRCFGALSNSQFSIAGLSRVLGLFAISIGIAVSDDLVSSNHGLGTDLPLVVATYLLMGVAVAQAARAVTLVHEEG